MHHPFVYITLGLALAVAFAFLAYWLAIRQNTAYWSPSARAARQHKALLAELNKKTARSAWLN